MTYFVECTHTFHTKLNFGIQRVVRNIVKAMSVRDGMPGHEAVPVIYEDGHFYQVPPTMEFPREAFNLGGLVDRIAERIHATLLAPYQLLRRGLAKLLPFAAAHRFLYAPRTQWGLTCILMLPFGFFTRWRARVRRARAAQSQRQPVVMQSGDVLVMLDSSSHIDHWKALDRIKQDGARLVFIVYDLIPYQYPQYCVEAHTYGFNRWISRVLDESDAVIAISHSIALEIEKSMPALRQKKSAPPVISHFLLGSDLDGEQAVGAVDSVPAKIKALFDTGVPTYIFVSTVEPRKNHAYALDAFERLWQENVRANFVIVGRLGWKFETFAGRVQGHAEFGRQLHMFNHVDDDALAFFYKNANALIFTSCVEGFGLPVVEGLQKGLPVFASDIPVFREIGVEGVEFVDIADPASLADKLARHIEAGAPRLCTPVRWLTWQESSDQLFARIDRSLMGTGSSACAAGQPFAPANLSEDSVAVAA